VTFLRAPDDVRAVIEQWVAAEPDCSASIELRVVPTENGYYLVAQRPDGRIHEREVPDATSAGVLVASWVADDWTAEAHEERAAEPTQVAEVRSEAPSESSLVVSSAPRERTTTNRIMTLGGLLGMSNGGGSGFRGELDLASRGIFSLGLAASISREYVAAWAAGWIDINSYRVMPELAANIPLRGNLSMRASLAAGIAYQDVRSSNPDPNTANFMPTLAASTWGRTGEAAVMMSYDFSAHVGVTLGSVLYYSQFDPNILGLAAGGVQRDLQLMGYGGARFRL
jgi:hypothetical protein